MAMEAGTILTLGWISKMVSQCFLPGVAWISSTVAQGYMRQETQKWPSTYSTMFYWSKQTQVKDSPDCSVPVGQIQEE